MNPSTAPTTAVPMGQFWKWPLYYQAKDRACPLCLATASALVCLAAGVVLGVLFLGGALTLLIQPAQAVTPDRTVSGTAEAVTQAFAVQELAPADEPAPVTGEDTNTCTTQRIRPDTERSQPRGGE